MIAVPKPKTHDSDSARDSRERTRQEDTPASDLVSVEQPTPPASDRDGVGE
jgi:hypothetical protein